MRPAWNISTVAMIVLSLLPLAAQGQWLQSNGPYAGEIRSILVDGNNVFAGSGGEWRLSFLGWRDELDACKLRPDEHDSQLLCCQRSRPLCRD
jgi:hypothetical protein